MSGIRAAGFCVKASAGFKAVRSEGRKATAPPQPPPNKKQKTLTFSSFRASKAAGGREWAVALRMFRVKHGVRGCLGLEAKTENMTWSKV